MLLDKRAQTSHGMFYDRKDNSVNLINKNETQNRERIMKASHFNIGNPAANMVCPKPTEPFEAPAQIGSFDVEAAKKSLR